MSSFALLSGTISPAGTAAAETNPPGQVAGGTSAAAGSARCKDVLFVGAMGSGERSEWKKTGGFGTEVKGVLDQVVDALPERSVERLPIDYPARSTDELNPLVGKLSFPSRVTRYFAGLSNGVDLAESELQSHADSCPSQAIVLAGYSQGAMVMHRALLRLRAAGRSDILERIAGVVLVADGDRVPNSNIQTIGDPAAGAAGQGIASVVGGVPNIPSRLWPYTYNICTKNDLVCDFRGAWSVQHFSAAKAVHSTYRESSIYMRIGQDIADVVMGWPKPTGPKSLTMEPGGSLNQQLGVSVRDGWLPRVRWEVDSIPPGWTLSATGLLSGTAAGDEPLRVAYTVRTGDRGLYSRPIPGTVTIKVGDTAPPPPSGTSWLPTPIRGLIDNLDCIGDAFCGAIAGENFLTWSGEEWSEIPAPRISEIYWPNGDSSIDCPAVGRCYSSLPTGSGVFISKYAQGAWSTAPKPLFDANARSLTTEVACGSVSSCIAVGTKIDNTLRVASLADGKWETAVIELEQATVYGPHISAADCLPTACLSSVTYQTGDGRYHSAVVMYRAGKWSVQTLPPVPATGQGAEFLRDVSCAADASFCLVGGNSAGQATIWTYAGGKWTGALAPLPGNAETTAAYVSTVRSVGCQTSGACAAIVDYNNNVSASNKAMIVRPRDHWVVPGNSDAGRIGIQVAGIACSSETYCVAAGYAPHGATPSVPYLWEWSAATGRWDRSIPSLGKVDAGWLSAVGCGLKACAAAGLSEGESLEQAGVVLTRSVEGF